MAIEGCEQLSATGRDPRRALRTDQTPPDLAELIVPALDAMIEAADCDND
jgi:hypothetical protein